MIVRSPKFRAVQALAPAKARLWPKRFRARLPIPPVIDPEVVADALRRSAAAHREYRQAIGRADRVAAEDALRRASLLRKGAHIADPEHSSQAWADEQKYTATGRDTHDELTAFYEQKVG